MRRTVVALIVLSALAAAATAQDTVRLRNGRILTGQLALADATDDGFSITLWDSGGTLFIRWSQVPDGEARRLRGRGATAAPAVTGEVIDGARIVTETREVVGVITAEDQGAVHVKTAASATPVQIPKPAIRRRDAIRISEAEAYSPEEMVNRRATGNLTAAKLIEVGHFARSLRLLARAREFYEKARQADATRAPEIERLLAALDAAAREAAAEAALAAIRKLQEQMKYEEALEAAQQFASEHAETEIGKQNREIVAQLTREKKDFDANRDKILLQRVPEAWKSARSSLLNKYADRRYRIGEARGKIDALDQEIAAAVSKAVNATPEEVERIWAMREQKPQTASMGSGSWIYRGGQDGGTDYTGGGDGKGEDPLDDFRRRFGGSGGGGQDPKGKDLGRPIDTSDQWWAAASQSARREWLLCGHAMNSSTVKKVKEEAKDCSGCRGVGTLKAGRGGKSVDVLCPRCHGSKQDLAVTFW